jgi:hypothetical protein
MSSLDPFTLSASQAIGSSDDYDMKRFEQKTLTKLSAF